MESRLLKMTLVFLLFAALAALSVPALGAENATVKGDGADLYERPYFSSPVIAHLTYGKRVEVIGWAHFPDAVEGYTAPWYRVSSGSGEGFIHGKYLALDAGVKIPMLPTAFEINDPTASEPAPGPKPVTPDANATITGDAVRVRGLPSTLGEVKSVLDKGARIEVIGKTGFIDTIDGRTARWYKTSTWGWVFGAFVSVDEGASVPALPFKFESEDGVPRLTFVIGGLKPFGDKKSEIIQKLGKPISETRKKSTCADLPDTFFYTLTYKDIVFRGIDGGWGESLYSVTYITDAYDFYGLKVGSSVADVERLLGKAYREKDPEGVEGFSYSGEKSGFVGWNGVNFAIGKNNTISSIEFWGGEINCGDDETW
ncbi:MAG: SH3 domain-containing protein [Deltaproteobacteria bacterium]|nr:SH3 domain-containing protein [Candidatus Zymogenaceae bacterium]